MKMGSMRGAMAALVMTLGPAFVPQAANLSGGNGPRRLFQWIRIYKGNTAMTIFRVITASIVFAAALIAAQPSSAVAIYNYTGSNYTYIANTTPPPGTYTTSMNVTGMFTLASPLAANMPYGPVTPLSFSFFDGRNAFSNLSPDLASATFNIATNAAGSISTWLISLERGFPPSYTPYYNLLTTNPPLSGGPAGQIYDQGYFTDNPALGASNRDQAISAVSPGSWTVPEPSPLSLMLVPLGLLLGGYGTRLLKRQF